MTKFLYEHVFRGIGWVLLFAVITILALWFTTSCGRTNAAVEARAKEKSGEILKRMHEGSDEAIRKYNRSQMQRKPKEDKQ